MSTGSTITVDQDKYLEEVISQFKQTTRLTQVAYDTKERSEGNYLIIYLHNPTDRFFKLLEQGLDTLPEENPYKKRTTIKKRVSKSSNRLQLPETQFLRTVLSESLTVTEHSFADDFFTRYIRSVSGDEEQIISQGNHIVYGRRGAGKSSLLAYLMHRLRQLPSPYAWVTIQTYSGRKDISTISEVLIDIIDQLKRYASDKSGFDALLINLEEILDKNDDELIEQLNRLIPRIRRAFGKIVSESGIFVFLDDIHVISEVLQPILLDKLYSICRGNRVFLKISGIEQFVKLRDPASRQGLETPGDIQVIRLDYNLTMPDKSKNHIQEILNSHATYCGLQSVDYICGKGVIDRLVWVAAGVPRDALYLFARAISESSVKGNKKVSVTSVNVAASEMTEEKLRDIKIDASGKYEEVNQLLESIRNFCVTEKRKNVFLVEIQNESPAFHKIEELIALRLLHILSSGFTPKEVGRRYMALMLDYGFYVGLRTAKSIDLFAKEPKPLQAQELRKFPRFKLPTAG
ncbi:ATP-binding protein [Synechococcus sp. PCC 7336]|uniref:ATP-binding protein n=1 Tax=Synechococcus sp. PCC 7336 TaxID=195250 RepID=UPI00034C1B69|nr:ATP-binding protein [Synechococcus sp. PCC 7336]